MRSSFWMLVTALLFALGCESSGTQRLTTPQVLTVSRIGAGQGSVTSDPSGIDCGTDCTATFNGSVTLTATSAQGSSFAGWGGECVVTDAGQPEQCTVTMDKAKTVLA